MFNWYFSLLSVFFLPKASILMSVSPKLPARQRWMKQLGLRLVGRELTLTWTPALFHGRNKGVISIHMLKLANTSGYFMMTWLRSLPEKKFMISLQCYTSTFSPPLHLAPQHEVGVLSNFIFCALCAFGISLLFHFQPTRWHSSPSLTVFPLCCCLSML